MAFCKKLGINARKLFALGWRDLVLLVEAWILLAWVDLLISGLPYKYWSYWLQEPVGAVPEPGPVDRHREQNVSRVIQLSEAAARNHLRPMNCLRRCFVQQRLLKRRDVASDLHIGVRKTAGGLEAHAWLSSQGRVLNDTPDVSQRYAQLQTAQWANISRFVS